MLYNFSIFPYTINVNSFVRNILSCWEKYKEVACVCASHIQNRNDCVSLMTLNSVDTFLLGRRMYPEYEQYWLSLLTNPNSGTENENAYARRADKIPHIVLSKTLDKVNGRRQGSFGMWKISGK